MSKSIKLKDNNYLDVSGISYNRNTLKDLIEGNDGKGFNAICFGDNSTGAYLDKYANIITRANITNGNWHLQNNGTNFLMVNFANGNITGSGGRVYREYALYNNTSGTTSEITLSDNASNYEYIEIFFRNNDNNYNSVRVYSPNSKRVTLMANYNNDNYTYVKTRVYTISGTKVTPYNTGSQSRVGNNVATTHGLGDTIFITRVVGYK